MDKTESLTTLPHAEVNGSYLDEEASFPAEGFHHHEQETLQYSSSSIGGLRKRISHIIHGQTYQIGVIALVLIDAAIVISILIIDEAIKDEHDDDENAELATEVLHYASICILSSFLVEILVKLFALGLDFFKHKMELFDAFIVITSFVLDLVMIHGAAVDIIILLRLWRVTRIVNGVVMSMKKKTEKEKKYLLNENENLSEQVHQLELKVTAQKKEISFLRSKLESVGITIDQPPDDNE